MVGGVALAVVRDPDPCDDLVSGRVSSAELKNYTDCRFDRLEGKFDRLEGKVDALASSAPSGPPPTLTRTPTETEPEPTPTEPTAPPPKATVGEFPIGVWLQNPAQDADAFAALGVNTYVGLWNWPYDDQAYPGWAREALDAAAAHNATVYAAESAAAVEKATELGNYDELSGFLGGDEPDMFNVSVQEWTARIEAMKAVSDKPVYGNFGKGFGGFDWWDGKLSAAQRAAYCEPLDIASVDYYGTTDPWEPAESRGTWVYGRAIDRVEAACGDKPVFGFVELTQPWKNSENAATPRSIREDAWSAVIHGADGLTFFLHDFWCEDGCDSIFSATWADNREAWADLNTELQSYAAALGAPDVTGAGAATSTGIPLALLTKNVGGKTLVFAQADGDRQHPDGYSGKAAVTVGGEVFTDDWKPYQVRVYTTDRTAGPSPVPVDNVTE